jgi:hypothetical protein
MIFINMKKKYTKSALERASSMILNEQIAPSINANLYKQAKLTPKATRSQTQKDILKVGKSGETMDQFWKDHSHDVMMAASIAALLIPIPGVNVAVSTAIAGADAAMYWNEGDKYTGGFIAVLSAIPLIGQLATKIPGVKQLGARGIKILAGKLAQAQKGAKPAFTAAEQAIVKALGTNKALVAKQTAAYLKKKAASKAVKTAGKVTTAGAKAAGSAIAAQKIWDPIYTKYGFDVGQIETASEPLFRKIKQLALRESKNPMLDGMIIEESYKLTEAWVVAPKPTQQNGAGETTRASKEMTDFFKWIKEPDQIYFASKYQITPSTKINDPKIKAAYSDSQVAEKYKTHLVVDKDKALGDTSKQKNLSDVESTTMWIQQNFKTVAAVLLTIGIGIWAYRRGRKSNINSATANAALTKPGNVAKALSYLKLMSKTKGGIAKSLQKEMDRLDISNEEVAEIQKALNQPGVTTSLAIQWRQIAINDFIKNGGKGGVLPADIIGFMTEKERKKWAPYVVRYAKMFK